LKALEEKYGIKIGIENGTKNILIGLWPSCYKEKNFSEIVSNSGFGMVFDISHWRRQAEIFLIFIEKIKNGS